MIFNQFCMANFIVKGLEAFHDLFTSIFWVWFLRVGIKTYTSSYKNMNVENGHDAKVHTLNPTDTGICQAKLTEVHPSKISWHPLPITYSPRYIIPQFPLERIMVNVLLYQCCAAQINSSRKSGRGDIGYSFSCVGHFWSSNVSIL